MPQLVKGGKWVFGWIIVGPGGEVQIPPTAFAEYGFQPGERVLFLPGSRRSGGFGVARREKLAQVPDSPVAACFWGGGDRRKRVGHILVGERRATR